MTLSLRKAALTLALLGGAGLMVAASATANAGPPDGYFNHRYRYIGPAFPPPAYAEIVPHLSRGHLSGTSLPAGIQRADL